MSPKMRTPGLLKNNRDMRTICPKIFAKLYFFVTMSQMGVAYSALKIFQEFLTFSQLYLLTQFLKFWKTGRKKKLF